MIPTYKINNFVNYYSSKVCTELIRSVAQLVEHRSPKPGVAGSIPATPAEFKITMYGSRLAW